MLESWGSLQNRWSGVGLGQKCVTDLTRSQRMQEVISLSDRDPTFPVYVWKKRLGLRHGIPVSAFVYGVDAYWLSGIVCGGKVERLPLRGHKRKREAVTRAELLLKHLTPDGLSWISGAEPVELKEDPLKLGRPVDGGRRGRKVVMYPCRWCGMLMPAQVRLREQGSCLNRLRMPPVKRITQAGLAAEFHPKLVWDW